MVTAVIPPALLAQVCPGDQPLLLLPVRLETRFFSQADGSSELRIRVYPDKIHLDSHEAGLTPAERDWAEHYWQQHWRAGHDAQHEADAWRQLAERYGAARAAWLVRVVRPVNPQEQPATLVPAGEPLPAAARFPAVEVVDDGQNASWRRAPLARLLPERWTAVAYSGGQLVAHVTGLDITEPLAVGPSPQGAIMPTPDDELAIDAGMKWMIDFSAAEAVGMGMRMTLAAPMAQAGLDTLLVFGASASLPPADGALQFAQLLDAHQYTDGLEFLRHGVPTNNTAEMRSGYGGADPGDDRSREALVNAAVAATDADSNARVFAAALGLATNALAHGLASAPGAARRHVLYQRCMNTALWPATWGYFLSNMVGFAGTGLTPDLIAWAREHFTAHVHGGGSFAALRCGKQPYGVLPVTSLDEWQPPHGAEREHAPDQWLRSMLLSLRADIWRARVANVPRIGRTADLDNDLAEVMRTDAQSSSYAVRPLLGRHYLQHLRAFMGENLETSAFNSTQEAMTVGILQRLNLPWRPRLVEAVYGDLAWRVSGPLVQAGEVSPWRGLEPNYIAALLSAPTIDAILRIPAASGDAASLLHALLRHSLLLEYVGAAAAIMQSQDIKAALSLRDHELIDLVPGSGLKTPTWKGLLEQKVAAVTGERTLREFLETLQQDFQAPAVAPLRAMQKSLKHLAGLDSEALLHLTQGTLDLASHRLDAWISSFAHKRLAAIRATQPSGLRIGGYGWVHDLRPTKVAATPVEPPPGETVPLVTLADDTGFIHAPSMAHAATAALLRNAHLGHDGMAQANGPFAIDLSSRRLRDARWLLDGVRQGQPLGALLGYRFERRLHELKLDRFIAGFRELAPLVGGKLEPSTAPLESIAANNVVDGLVLWQRWNTTEQKKNALLASQPDLLGAPFEAVKRELDALGESIDALSDALTAETAYQLVRGNVSRTASTLAAVAGGDAPAPELEVARTPRTGIGLTHRVVLAFSGKPATTPGWTAAAASPRAAAEPMLNAWTARLLGNPRTVVCRVEQLDAAGTTVLQTHEVKLSDLKLAPLDLVYGVDANARRDQPGEIELRLLHHLRSTAAAMSADTRLRVAHGRAGGASAKLLALDDVLTQAASALRLLTVARGLDATDLELPERGAEPGLDLLELQARTDKAEKALLVAHKALLAWVKPGAVVAAEKLRAGLMRALGFGIAGSIPVAAIGDDEPTRTALRAQALAVAKEMQSRLDRGAAARIAGSNSRDALVGRLRTVFGDGFAVMPRFACANPAPLAQALAASTAVQGGDPLAVNTWLTRCERVRDSVARLATALRGAEVLATGDTLQFAVAQLPQGPNERWVALPPAAGGSIPPGRLSLVIHAGNALDTAQPLAGLMVDEWVEVVPSRSETTALAFQYNPPDVCAPQALLLAVPPVIGRAWTLWDLHRLLLDTLELSKLRAVDVEALGELGHYLPALTFGYNANDDAVSTDFGPLSR